MEISHEGEPASFAFEWHNHGPGSAPPVLDSLAGDPARAAARQKRIWEGPRGAGSWEGFLWGPEAAGPEVNTDNQHAINVAFFRRLFRISGIGMADPVSFFLLVVMIFISFMMTAITVEVTQPAMSVASSISLMYLQRFSADSPGVQSVLSDPSVPAAAKEAILAFQSAAAEAVRHNIFGTGNHSSWVAVCDSCELVAPAAWGTYLPKSYSTFWNEQPPKGWIGIGGVCGTLAAWGLLSAVVGLVAGMLPQFLGVRMRLVVTWHLHKELFYGGSFYKTIVLDKDVDNYDQRITDDVLNSLQLGFAPLVLIATTLVTAIFNLVTALITLRAYTQYGEASSMLVPLFLTTSIGLAAVAFGAFLAPMNRVSKLLFTQKRLEGDYRWIHCRLMEFSEPVALYGGEARDEEVADAAFDRVCQNYCRLTFYSCLLTGGFNAFFMKGAIYTATYCILYFGSFNTYDIFNLQLELSSGFMAMMQIPTAFMSLAAAGGSVHRVGEFLEAIRRNRQQVAPVWNRGNLTATSILPEHLVSDENPGRPSLGPGRISIAGRASIGPRSSSGLAPRRSLTSENPRRPMLEQQERHGSLSSGPITPISQPATEIRTVNLTAAVPGAPHLVLFRHLSLTVGPGDSTAIVGPSGCGKSSLLRVLAGLWPATQGHVHVPKVRGESGIAFLPQRPYVTAGTLLEQVVYPYSVEAVSEQGRERALGLLRDVGLSATLDEWGLDSPADWRGILGPGDLQKLAFGRLFFHRPAFALMDEATSAIDLQWEANLMRQCERSGVTAISVCHRPSAIALHKRILRYTAESVGTSGDPSSWRLEEPADRAANLVLPEVSPDDVQLGQSFCSEIHEIDPPMPEADKDGAGWLFFKRFRYLMKLAVPTWYCPAAQAVYLTVLMSVIIAVCIIGGTSLSGLFINDLSSGDAGSKQRTGYVLLFFFVQPFFLGGTYFFSAWVCQALALHVRRCAVNVGHLTYFTPRVPYVLNAQPFEAVPGSQPWQPDQRLQQDSSQLTDNLAAFVFGGASSPGLLGHAIVLSLAFIYAAVELSWIVTALTLGTLAVLGLLLSLTFGPVANGTTKALRAEGVFRLAHAQIREFAESIAFHGGEPAERARMDELLIDELSFKYYRLCWRSVPLEFFNTTVSVVMGYVPTIFCSFASIYVPAGWSGRLTADTFSGAVNFFGSMALIIINTVTCFAAFGALSGRVHRVVGFIEAAESAGKVAKGISDFAGAHAENFVGAEGLCVQSPAVLLPDGRISKPRRLITDLSFQLLQKSGLMVQGGTGSGKSSLLRVFSGLWRQLSGSTFRPLLLSPDTVGRDFSFFLPQVPYTTEGTLREQVLYPLDPAGSDTERILEVLKAVSLWYLVDRWGLDTASSWSSHLSGGEMQRVGFARLLYHRPTVAFLDEATSALDVALEKKCLGAAREAGISLVTVSHRDTTLKMHDYALRLHGDGRGSWDLRDLALSTSTGPGASSEEHVEAH